MRSNSTTVSSSFPSDIDRRDFGNWLSGFVDGEGCFILHSGKRKHRANTTATANCYAHFRIEIRSDDIDTLTLIQAFWQCGWLYSRLHSTSRVGNPTASLCVAKWGDLLNVIVPHFHAHPLHAKKARDFAVWEQGVRLGAAVSSRPLRHRGGRKGSFPRWETEDIAEFKTLANVLREQRRYE